MTDLKLQTNFPSGETTKPSGISEVIRADAGLMQLLTIYDKQENETVPLLGGDYVAIVGNKLQLDSFAELRDPGNSARVTINGRGILFYDEGQKVSLPAVVSKYDGFEEERLYILELPDSVVFFSGSNIQKVFGYVMGVLMNDLQASSKLAYIVLLRKLVDLLSQIDASLASAENPRATVSVLQTTQPYGTLESTDLNLIVMTPTKEESFVVSKSTKIVLKGMGQRVQDPQAKVVITAPFAAADFPGQIAFSADENGLVTIIGNGNGAQTTIDNRAVTELSNGTSGILSVILTAGEGPDQVPHSHKFEIKYTGDGVYIIKALPKQVAAAEA